MPLYKKINKKYTGCNLMDTELLDCALIEVCAVIRSNTVFNSSTDPNCVQVLEPRVSSISLVKHHKDS